MIEIEKMNFNYNPAILATCVTEINKLQINMKYNKDSNRISNLLLYDTYKKGLQIRSVPEINKISEDIINLSSDSNELYSTPNNNISDMNEIDDPLSKKNNFPDSIFLNIENMEEKINDIESQQIIDMVMNKDDADNIKININEKK